MKIGCHVLYDKRHVYTMQVVTLDAEGVCLYYNGFTNELPSVVWNPGVCILLPKDTVPSPGDRISDLSAVVSETGPCFLWSAVGLPTDAGTDVPVMQWQQCR